ncbi:LOW QUALITY PROTEIN: PDZ domain-containing RING finger protein 4 [Anguilla anguilla]|uniref:LOW QUALITY PROTEIN: PDZ domain-containing RING finger protein 4 n=1 Tax=Anguilla anguilla TaxID=7936 RepID=UPI0015B00869|nr:LOW QUALITY PROTEIN: PDZ domain-containing RING finger protein 4 [Anguilla anguilla]
MGCSLCALRKREERYRLLYEIAQVNGKVVSKVTAEEAAEALRGGGDPMAAQVPQRNPASPGGHGNPRDARLADVCTQTDITFQHIMALAKLRPLTPPLPDLCPFLLSDSCHSLQTVEQEFYEGTEYLSHTPASGERADEFEYEEVELCRLNSQEKLGLTLCYRTDEEEEDAGIYVSEVGLDSVAARDGRIREGDRILQINGQDVQNREEAVTALSDEDCRNILLLVARPEIQLEEGWLDDEQSRFLEELKMEMLEEQRKEEDQRMSSGEQQPKGCEEEEDEEETTTDATTRSSNTQDPVEPEPGPPSRATEQEGVQRELRLLSEELRSIERECQSIMQARRLRLARDPAPSPAPADKDSSSAYDTAESCRSTPPPPARRRSPDRSAQSAVSAANLRNLSRTAAPPAPSLSPSRHGDVPAHARRYQSSAHLVQQSQLGLPTAGRDPPPPPPPLQRAEWRAQRCPARRPARDRLLRERALKIREERGGGGGGTTTDDDAASELKLGRYWSREERKQHLLRAREQRRRREFMMRSRLESLRESPQSGGEGGGGGRKEVSILELSRRKMMRKRRRKILDNWMTIQELMSHGARRPEDTGVHSAFLSVTTV